MKDLMSSVRFLRSSDVDALMALEAKKWEMEQAADAQTMLDRIECYPDLSIGAFDSRTGELLASLFMKPIDAAEVLEKQSWQDLATVQESEKGRKYRDLFGISLSSRKPAAVEALMIFFWPYALKKGLRHIYLGSPMPGLRVWQQRFPDESVEEYIRLCKGNIPIDPQIRYYRTRGFTRLVTVKRDYFPHADSLDYGAILRGEIPLHKMHMLWRVLPLKVLVQFRQQLFRMF